MTTCPLLEGIRVLDLSQYIPGPYATRLLADLGADVIKIEQPGGDPLRTLAGPARIAPEYLAMNGGKRVCELDLKDPLGHASFDRLLADADLLLESFRPGVLARLGYDPERLKSINPTLVHCALSGWGQTGPYRGKAGHDINYMSLGGGLDTSGVPERPHISFPPVADYASGLQAAFTALATLFGRSSGAGVRSIDVSIMETVLSWQAIGLTQSSEGRLARGADLLNGGAASYHLYRTSDGRFVSLGIVGERKFWLTFCAAVGRHDLKDRLFDPMPQLGLIEELSRLFSSRTMSEWDVVLSSVETCFQPVVTFEELPHHPHIIARQMVDRKDGPGRYDVRFPAWMEGEPPPQRPGPSFVASEGLEWLPLTG